MIVALQRLVRTHRLGALHEAANSTLIKGYGWELEYGVHFFEKN